MNHPDEASLHDFVDGELPKDERARVAGHLADCSTCQGVVTDLRDLREDARRVFGAPGAHEALAPPNQWEKIQERLLSAPRARGGIADQRVRAPHHILRRAATIALIVGGSGATTWLLVRSESTAGDPSPATASPVAATGGPTNRPRASLVVAAYQPAITGLERLLAEGRGRLRPETVAILEDNLRIIDAAIADVEEALASDPAHPAVLRSLDGILQAKLSLLREAVGLTRGA